MGADVERRAGLRRFEPDVEAEYGAWLSEEVRPLATVIAGLGLAVWIVLPPLTSAFLGEPAPALIWWCCYALNGPVCAAFLLLSRRRGWPGLPAAFALGTLAVVVGSTLNPLATAFIDNAPGIIVANATFYSMVCSFARVPFRWSAVVAVPVTATAAVVMAVMVGDGTVTAHSTWFYWALLSGVLPVALGSAWVGERTMRGTFTAERLIAQQRVLIRRYAPRSVTSRIEAGDGTVDLPQRRRVTVFFCDVVGFTALADRLDPEALAEIVNQYLGSLAEIVENHGGTLNEFAGDGVMALFGAPDEMDAAEQVRAALGSAWALQDALPTWSTGWGRLGVTDEVRTRIGINTGVVSVGTYGSAVRATYTGIGLQTNIAARVQAECPPGSVLLSGTSWHYVKDAVPCTPRGAVEVKGVHFPIEMYEPDGRTG